MGRPSSKPAVNHLRAWREHRKMTQEALADAVGTAPNVIHQLETGKQRLSDKWLYRLAPALGTKPGFLLEFAPDDMYSEYMITAMSVDKKDQTQALAILKTFRKSSSTG